jgi:hypothetical protein
VVFSVTSRSAKNGVSRFLTKIISFMRVVCPNCFPLHFVTPWMCGDECQDTPTNNLQSLLLFTVQGTYILIVSILTHILRLGHSLRMGSQHAYPYDATHGRSRFQIAGSKTDSEPSGSKHSQEFNLFYICIVFIVCNVSLFVFVVLCAVFCLSVVCYFVWCVLCLISTWWRHISS